MDIVGVDVEIDVIKEYPELEDLVVNPSTEDQNFNSSKYGFKSVKINAIKGEEIDLTPSTEEQVATGIFSKVKVNPIESKKLSATPTMEEQVITGLFDTVVVNPIETEELYAIPSTEEQVKTGLFNTVVVSPIQGETLNLAPSEEQQSAEGVFTQVNINPIQVEEITTDLDFSASDEMELTAKEGVYIKKAIINKDVNLTPENIKSGVSVCGIAGGVADTSDADATSDDILLNKTAYVDNEKIRGTYEPLDTSDATATAEDIALGKTAYVNNEKIVGALESDHEVVASFMSSIDNTLGANTTKLPSGITNIRAYTFYHCTNLALKELPEGITTLGEYAFYWCSNLAITEFPQSLTHIWKNCFQNCGSLKEITFKSAVYIANNAFKGCSNLEKIVFQNVKHVPSLPNKSAFEETKITANSGSIYVPDDLVESFKTTGLWAYYVNIIKPLSTLQG